MKCTGPVEEMRDVVEEARNSGDRIAVTALATRAKADPSTALGMTLLRAKI
jgi:hypothetical protein